MPQEIYKNLNESSIKTLKRLQNEYKKAVKQSILYSDNPYVYRIRYEKYICIYGFLLGLSCSEIINKQERDDYFNWLLEYKSIQCE
jgi:hypothetical protein